MSKGEIAITGIYTILDSLESDLRVNKHLLSHYKIDYEHWSHDRDAYIALGQVISLSSIVSALEHEVNYLKKIVKELEENV